MKSSSKWLFLTLVLFVLNMVSCVQPLELTIDEAAEVLVVDGFIDTNFGPHQVILTRSAKYGSVFDGQIKKVTNAIVRIKQLNGTQVFLEEVKDGIYETPIDFKAIVGESYTLTIDTEEGAQYISIPEKVPGVPDLLEVRADFKKQPTANPLKFTSGMEIFAKFKDPEDEQNFYKWEVDGVYKLFTFLDMWRSMDPLDIPPTCCDVCWIFEDQVDENINLLSDRLINGNENFIPVAFINDDGGRFSERYIASIEQRSLTREAFQFLSLLENQLQIQGNIFDPPPATIGGNIINISSPDEPVIGFFYASDVKHDTIQILPPEILENQTPRVWKDDCRTFPGASLFPPHFW